MASNSEVTIWSVEVPTESGYAELLNIWNRKPIGNCPKCNRPRYSSTDLLSVEWDEGSDKIGDFTFIIGPVVVRESVADFLLEHVSGFEKGRIEMPDHPNLRKPVRPRRVKPRVWLPYQGPPLCYIKSTRMVELNGRSTVEVSDRCSECGGVGRVNIDGVSVIRGGQVVARTPGKGLFVDRASLAGDDVFAAKGLGFTLCTERVRRLVTERNLTNVLFLEVGEFV